MTSAANRHHVEHVPTCHVRVPDDLPALLQASQAEYGWQLSKRVLLTAYLPVVALFSLLAIRSLLVAIVLVAIAALLFALRFVDEARKARTPLLGADERGLFLRPNGTVVMALHMPWPHIRELAVRRAGGVSMLCVTPVDPTFTGLEHQRLYQGPKVGFFVFTAYLRAVKRLGTPLFVPIVGADPPLLLAELESARRSAR